MKLLGIDYGRAKIGLAVAESGLAVPLLVVKVSSFKDSLEKIEIEIETQKPDMVVVGVSEAAIGEEQTNFASSLSLSVSVPVVTWDEGLSTQDAQALALQAGKKRKKRREMEDAYAAAVVLQSYLDTKNPNV